MDGITGLAVATALFVGTHLLLSHPLRNGLVRRIGEGPFAGLYSLVAAGLLGWMVIAYRGADPGTPLWVLPAGLWWAASALMLVAAILLAGSLVRNPALPHPCAAPRDIPPACGVFAITRHPMNWSFMLWALVHGALIGEPRNLIVAGGIFLLALVGSVGQDRKKARLIGEAWRDWQRRTSFVPFAAVLAGRVRARAAVPGAVAWLGGFAIWAAVTWFHAPQWGLPALLGR